MGDWTWPYSGVLHSGEGGAANIKQRSPTDGLCPSPLRQAAKWGPRSSRAAGQDERRQPQGLAGGQPGREAGARTRLSLSRRSSPGNILQPHLFRVACLTEHPKQFRDYISLSHLFAKGVSQAPEVGCPAAPRSPLHTHTHTHTQRHPLTETHNQGPLGARRAPPETRRHAHVADAQTWSPASHHCPSRTGPCRRTRQGSQIVSRAHTHAHGSTPSVARGRPESQSPRAKGATSRPFPGKLAGDPPPPRPQGSLR